MKKLLLNGIITLLTLYSLPSTAEIIVPGMSIGLRHNVNQFADDPPVNYIPSIHYIGGDYAGMAGQGYEWDHVYDYVTQPMSVYASSLPPGVVFGLMHSINNINDNITTFGRNAYTGTPIYGMLVKQHGGDLGAPAGHGYYWYETDGSNTDFDPRILNDLPSGTIVGLKHSNNQPNKTLIWNHVIYNPSDMSSPIPPGFSRKFGGDLGAQSWNGYWWFEKI